MKKIFVAAALASALTAAAPVAAQDANDPFVSSAGPAIPPLVLIMGTAAVVIAVAASSGTN